MKHHSDRDARSNASVLHRFGLIALFVSTFTGCSGTAGDSQFSAESYDEYTQPLVNAVVGTPSGLVTIGPDGGATLGSGGAGNSGEITSSEGGIAPEDAGGFEDGGGGFEDGGQVDSGEGGVPGGFGFWHFNDCSPTSNFLIDSSGEGANAQQALGADCVPGISGLGVEITNAKEVIQVPDEPQFTITQRIAVAAWVHPTTVTGDQPIVIKRLNNETAFSLGIHNGNIQMSVVLTTGTTVISSAPISAGVWTHVAGMFDGTFVFLFINGEQFGQVFGAGTVRDVFAPLRIGATSQTQHFDGIIDEVFVSTQPETAAAIEALACISNPSTLTVSPAVGGPVTFDTTLHYVITVNDNDIGFCSQRSYNAFSEEFDPTINVVVDPPQFGQTNPGTTMTFGVDVTADENATPGVDQIPISIFDQSENQFAELTANLTFDLTAPTGCFVFIDRELMITDPSVVDDPVRTAGSTTGFGADGGVPEDGGVIVFDAGSAPVPPSAEVAVRSTTDAEASPDAGTSASLGVWTFGHLLREMAPTAAQAPAMTLQLFQNWLTNQTVNGFTVVARPAIQQVLLDIWPKTANGELDLDQAPLTLEAIVSRIDLRNLSNGSAGEGRFIFGVNGPGFPEEFTVILHYNLPAKTQNDVLAWANLWHGLSALPFPSAQYNAALESVTNGFTKRNASPESVNGSALLSLRTNEIALSFQWELRQFQFSPTTGFFVESPLTETPDLSFNGTQTFADFVNENAAAIIAEVPGAAGTTVTPTFEGVNFQAGSVFNNLIEWTASGINDPNARFHASENTCNGCHGPETGTTFLQIAPRFPGSAAVLSPFLTGTVVVDPVTGLDRSLNDLERRQTDLSSLVCTVDGGTSPADAGSPPPLPADAASPPDAGKEVVTAAK
jgi:hypothetical protein